MSNSRQEIHLRSSARTSTGQVRENNEDNIHLWTWEDFVLAIVADGMGGAAAGEEASRMAVEAIEAGLVSKKEQSAETTWQKMPDDVIAQKLRDAIRTGNLSIMERASSDPELRGMGTTITLAFVRGDHAIIAHVGDSRAYLVGGWDQTISQITADHSFVEALVAAGHITQEQADVHPMRNVLYRALGQSEDVDIDLYHTHLDRGDRLILCSDGLTRHVKPSEICDLAVFNDDPDIASQKLIDLANARGGEDNVSVIIIKVEGDALGPDTTVDLTVTPNETDDTVILRSTMKKIIPPPDLSDDPDDITLRDLPDLLDDQILSETDKDQAITRRSDALDKSDGAPDSKNDESEGKDSSIPDQ